MRYLMVAAASRRCVGWSRTSLVIWSLALVTAAARMRARLVERDDEGLSSPEKAALTVLGLVLAGIVATAATNYVRSKTASFR